jgi:hypothetical protein
MNTNSYLQRLFNRLNKSTSQRSSHMTNKIKTALVALAIGLAASKGVWAATSDALTITITPNANYAVDIDTTNVALDMGTVSLGASTQTVRPSTVTIQSTYATTDLKIQGSISGGWSFDSNTASSEADALAVWATFTSVSRSSAPTQTSDYFSGTVPGAASSDVVDTTSRYVGSSVLDSSTSVFENNSGFDSQDMDSQAPSAQAHLWLYFRLPSSTTNNTAKNVTITLTAVQPN